MDSIPGKNEDNHAAAKGNHRYPSDMFEDEVDLFDYIRVLVKRRWLLFWGTVICIAATGILTLLKNLDPEYEAKAMILPSGKSDYLKTGIDDAEITESLYPKIMESRPFKEAVVNDEYEWGKGETLKKGALVAAFGVEKTDVATGILSANVAVESERQGIITITVTTSDPKLSAGIANSYIKQLQIYNTQIRNSNAKHNLEFIEQRIAVAKDELTKSEEVREEFYATHRELSAIESAAQSGTALRGERMAKLKSERDRLEREVTVKEGIYATLTNQYELAKIEAEKDVPVFTVLENALPPNGPKSFPLRRNLLIAAIVGMFFSVTVAFILEYTGDLAEEKKDFIKREINIDKNRFKALFSQAKAEE